MVEKKEPWYGATLLSFVGIAVLGVLIFGHTLHAPWYFDDMASIVDNIAIRNLGQSFQDLFSGRGLAQLTFALNYRFGGLEVAGYHLVNISIHIVSSCLVLLILKRVFRSALWWQLLGALLFLVHPLQTQAVTYLVQRMTSLSGLFFFLSLYFFILFREEIESRPDGYSFRVWIYYLFSLGCGAAALLSKQNAAILPLALLLFDSYFLPRPRHDSFRKRLGVVLPFFVFPLWSGYQQVVAPFFQGAVISELGSTVNLASQQHISVANYFVTEFSVIWLYIRLLFLPYGQVLDYGYPLVTTLLTLKSILALAGIIALLSGAFLWRRKLPLISCGIFWFFLALSVESTFIPLDPVFEHRLYVPMFGFVLVVVGLLQLLPRPRLGHFLLLLLIVAFAGMAWLRNDLWNAPIALVEDNLRQTPRNERMHVALSKSYLDAGRLDEALTLLHRAIEINPEFDSAYLNLSAIYFQKGENERALEALQRGLVANPFSEKLHNNLGTYYLATGQLEKAKRSFEEVIAHNPFYPDSYVNLGIYYAEIEQLEKASVYYLKAIALSHENAAAHINLASAYYRLQRLSEALQELKVALKQDPRSVHALVNIAVISKQLGDKQAAFAVLPQLREVNRSLADELEQELSK